MGIIISPSLLGYEEKIRAASDFETAFQQYATSINAMLEAGIEWLHIDVMRQPFIPEREAFSEQLMQRLYQEFAGRAHFDFHLMVADPRPTIDFIDGYSTTSIIEKLKN